MESQPVETMSVDEKLKILLSIAEECINPDELRSLIASGKPMIFYDGFEPSGRMHIAQGLLRAHNVNKITSVGGHFIFWVADFFAQMNHKLGGDIDKIRDAGKLMIEIWKACGMKMENVEFIRASEEMVKRPGEHLKLLIDVATKFTIGRMKKCAPALGREETEEFVFDEDGKPIRAKSDEQTLSTLLYSAMQVADIPFLKVNVASLGVDQRKILVINRELAEKNKNRHPPILLLHHMLLGLDGSKKMAKADPDNAIFMDDPAPEVNRKIKKAFCPEKVIAGNPILELVRFLIFEKSGQIQIKRSVDNGGDIVFTNVDEFEAAFAEGKIHPGDLKPNVARILNEFLEPVREHFAKNPEAAKLATKVKNFKLTK